MNLTLLGERFAVCRLDPTAPLPSWAASSSFLSIARTPDELSIVCDEALTPAGAKVECGWEVLKLHGPFTFDQIGVLASCVTPLVAHGVSVFTISTFDTDYLLIKAHQTDAAVTALQAAGHMLEQ